jgi:hypothetical protein
VQRFVSSRYPRFLPLTPCSTRLQDNQEVYGTRSFPPEKLKLKPEETDLLQHGRQRLGVSHGQHVNAKKRKSPDGGIAVKTAAKVVKRKRFN